MKIDARRTASILRDPSIIRAALLHGDDEGLIRERASALVKAVLGAADDPFRLAELDRGAWPSLAAEAASLALTGGRRVVRIRDAADALLGPLREALAGPGEALIVIEAPGLGKGRLRSFADTDPAVASIACYPETGAALAATIERQFADRRVRPDRDALRWLTDHAGEDRGIVRGEIEKLSLLAGADGRLTLEDVTAASADGGSASVDDAVLASLRGDLAAADLATDRALADGVNAVALMRMTLLLLQRLHQARARIDDGATTDQAISAMRPPVFFKTAPAIRAVLDRCTTARLAAVIALTRDAEFAAKQTGSHPDLLARRLIFSLVA